MIKGQIVLFETEMAQLTAGGIRAPAAIGGPTLEHIQYADQFFSHLMMQPPQPLAEPTSSSSLGLQMQAEDDAGEYRYSIDTHIAQEAATAQVAGAEPEDHAAEDLSEPATDFRCV
jgi:hypothetical protein